MEGKTLTEFNFLCEIFNGSVPYHFGQKIPGARTSL